MSRCVHLNLFTWAMTHDTSSKLLDFGMPDQLWHMLLFQSPLWFRQSDPSSCSCSKESWDMLWPGQSCFFFFTWGSDLCLFLLLPTHHHKASDCQSQVGDTFVSMEMSCFPDTVKSLNLQRRCVNTCYVSCLTFQRTGVINWDRILHINHITEKIHPPTRSSFQTHDWFLLCFVCCYLSWR